MKKVEKIEIFKTAKNYGKMFAEKGFKGIPDLDKELIDWKTSLNLKLGSRSITMIYKAWHKGWLEQKTGIV
jgi:hypothetical protein